MSSNFGGRPASNSPSYGNSTSNNNTMASNNMYHMNMRLPPTPGTGTSLDEDYSTPTLCHLTAMTMCYRRLALVLCVGPLVCVIVPILVKMLIWCLSFHFVILAIVLTWIWDLSLRSVAPSRKLLNEARMKSRWTVPLAALLLSYFALYLLPRLEFSDSMTAKISSVFSSLFSNVSGRINSFGWSLPTTPTISWGLGFSPAMGLLLIDVALLCRFVGQLSMVRASTFPLVSNEITNAFASVLLAARPDTNSRSEFKGRRSKLPSMGIILTNMIFCGFIGYLVAEFMWRSWWRPDSQTDGYDYYDEKRSQFIIDVTGMLTLVFQLLATVSDDTAHELNPRKYHQHHQLDGASPIPVSFQTFASAFARGIVFAISATAVSVGILYMFCFCGMYCDGQQSNHFFALFDIKMGLLMLFCCLASTLAGLYAGLADEAIRTALCTPGSKLQRFVQEITLGGTPQESDSSHQSSASLEEEEDHIVDVMLHSVLHGDAKLVKELWEPTSFRNPNLLDFERYEAERNSYAIASVAKVLLGSEHVKRPLEAFLEEDCLRLSILESMGGSITAGVTSTAKREFASAKKSSLSEGAGNDNNGYPSAQRHRETIQYWVLPPSTATVWKNRYRHRPGNEPKGAVLVRALCAYTGGLGQALIELSRPTSQSIMAWVLPQAAILAAEYSVIALSRCIAQNLEHNREIASDWRNSHLSMLIPATLNSAFRLHIGIVVYALSLKRGAPNPQQEPGQSIFNIDIAQEIGKSHPDLLRVLYAIDGAVSKILKQLAADDADALNMPSFQNALDENCSQWVKRRMQHS